MKYVEYDVGGRHLRLLLSIYATKKIAERFGTFEKFGEKIQELEPVAQLAELIAVIAILAEAGKRNAEIMGEDCDTIKAEELEALLPMDSNTMEELSKKITESFNIGNETTLEAKDESKNA